MFKYLSLLLFIALSFHSGAQVYPFVNYTPRDGLVGNKVRFIRQDSNGKLYFGTSNGLSIYDGSRFTNYTVENGLFNNLVNGIVEAGPDSILIIFNGNGLQYIRNGKIKNFSLADSFCPVINEFITCSNGDSYAVADEGLFKFEKSRFSKIELNDLPAGYKALNLHHATELDSFLIINMVIDNPAYPSPRLLIAYNFYTGKTITSTSLPDVYYSIKTKQGELILATAKGIFSLDQSALDNEWIELFSSSSYYSIPDNTVVDYMYLDRRQNLWLAADYGVLKVSPQGFAKLFTEQNGLPTNKATSILQDREGIMWFGSDLTGVAKLVDQNLEFYKEFKPDFSINDIAITARTDSVWMYNRKHGLLLTYNNITREFGLKAPEALFWITMDKEGGYGATGSSIYKLQSSSKTMFAASLLYKNPVNGESFSCLMMDRKRNPIAVGHSIIAVLPGNKIVRQPLDYYADKAVLTRDDFLYVITRTTNIYIYKLNPGDTSNYLQLVARYNWETENHQPRAVTVDPLGRLWIGTRERGLFCYTTTNGQLKLKLQLTIKDGLTENFIRNLYCDETGQIWAGTPTGLDRIVVQDNGASIENITRASNMYLDIHKVMGSSNGIIWALASSGLVKVYPAFEPTPRFIPEIIFTKFTASNQEQSLQKEVSLKHFQNSLFFQVAVPSFFDEKKTLFSYKLEEGGSSDGVWTDPSSRSDISFLNLPPGHYHLHVQAVFSNGKYAPLEKKFSFIILTPWWKTWWFRLIELAAALFVIVLLFRLYYRSKMQRQRIDLEKKQAVEKERTRIAIDMHDDMGAGLSRIKVLSETIKFENQKGIVNPSHLQKISVYSEEMMDKMGEIVWALNQRNDSLSDLLSYTRSYATDYLTNHSIHCSFHVPASLQEIFVSGEVRRNIFLSVKEALHNVVKHSGATHVDIDVKAGTEFSILIHDNGKGIDLDKLRKFGNGINNIRKRMTEIKGVAEFKKENGTVVKLTIRF